MTLRNTRKRTRQRGDGVLNYEILFSRDIAERGESGPCDVEEGFQSGVKSGVVAGVKGDGDAD